MVKIIDGKAYVVAYDLRAGMIVWSLVNYAIFLTETLFLEPSSIDAALRSVTTYRNFLIKKFAVDRKKQVDEFQASTDALMEAFRDEEFEVVRSRWNSSHEDAVAKRTVNRKLVHIYNFLNWYQFSNRFANFFGGEHGAVTTSLKSEDINIRKNPLNEGGSKYRYPLLYRRVGERARQPRGYEATQKNVDALRHYFFENFTDYVAIRNNLIMDIADRIGWRRGSINSLTCDQFSDFSLDKMTDRGLICVPAKQKNGYLDSFYIPPALVFRIVEFIRGPRQTLVEEMGWRQVSGVGPVFISARDGCPLEDKTISTIFGKAFSAIGVEKRAALHSLRTKFVNDAIAAETDARLKLGLDTSSDSISAAVSHDLGHHNIDSIKAYTSANQTRLLSRKRQR
ncbi:hypothetical protein [Burkholderia sp. 3C]